MSSRRVAAVVAVVGLAFSAAVASASVRQLAAHHCRGFVRAINEWRSSGEVHGVFGQQNKYVTMSAGPGGTWMYCVKATDAAGPMEWDEVKLSSHQTKIAPIHLWHTYYVARVSSDQKVNGAYIPLELIAGNLAAKGDRSYSLLDVTPGYSPSASLYYHGVSINRQTITWNVEINSTPEHCQARLPKVPNTKLAPSCTNGG